MAQSIDLGGGGNAFPFDTPGAQVVGKIINITEQQQTDLDSGEPLYWDNNQPRMMVVVELQTDLRDPGNVADDGKRSVYLRGSRKPESESSMAAVLSAVKTATQTTQLNVGGTLGLQYIGDGPATQRGKNPPKRYRAMYRPPSVNLEAAGQPEQAQPGWQAQQPPNQFQQPPPQQPDPNWDRPVPQQQWGPPEPAPQQQWGPPPQQQPQAPSYAPPAQQGYAPPQAQPNGAQQPATGPEDDPGYAAYQQWQASQGQG